MELINKNKKVSVSDSSVENNSLSNLDLDLYNWQFLKQKYPSNPFISYLNINSLSNKIDALRQICKISPLEILCVDETKLDSSVPNSRFKIDGYIFPPYRRDRDNHGRGKMVFIREGLITKRLVNLESKLCIYVCMYFFIYSRLNK